MQFSIKTSSKQHDMSNILKDMPEFSTKQFSQYFKSSLLIILPDFFNYHNGILYLHLIGKDVIAQTILYW